MAAIPDRDALPRYVAPLPGWLEDFALARADLLIAVNLAGTAFGFWFYRFQFAAEPVLAWPVVPDSPTATFFIAAALAAWRYDTQRNWLTALAFLGCFKLGLWTPAVLLLFKADFNYLHPLMYNFLVWSHLAMAAQAFLLYRLSDFPVGAVAVAAFWYGFNDVVDYFVPVVGPPHHTYLPVEAMAGGVSHAIHAHDQAAAIAISLTLVGTFLALATRIEKLELATAPEA